MKSIGMRGRMKKNDKIQACLDLREGGDEWMRKHVLPPKPSQGHQKEGDQLCVHMSVCGCVCVRADQQLGVGVNAWMTDQFLLTLPLYYTSIRCKIQENARLCTLRFLGTCRRYFPSLLPESPKSWRKQQWNPEPLTHTTNWSLPGMTQLLGFFSLPPNHNDSFNLNLRKYILQACGFWMHLKEWKVQANMTSAENKEYSGGWGWKGAVNVVHVRVCVTAKMCVWRVGVPVKLCACDWVL